MWPHGGAATQDLVEAAERGERANPLTDVSIGEILEGARAG